MPKGRFTKEERLLIKKLESCKSEFERIRSDLNVTPALGLAVLPPAHDDCIGCVVTSKQKEGETLYS